MPNTVSYRPVLIDELISTHRINSYSKVFSIKNDAELVGVYLWNSHVCSALYPLLSTAEIALRNSIDHALKADLGKFWWKKSTLQYKSFTPAKIKLPRDVQYIENNFSAAFNNASKDKRKRLNKPFHYKVNPEHQEIVAKTEFSTWEFILDNEFMGNNLIWPKNLGKVFRGVWPTTQATNMLAQTKDLVSLVRNFRNRVFHHEPAWKKFGVTNEQQAITHLHEKISKIVELISLISPEQADLLNKCGTIKNAYRACSLDEIERFKYTSKTDTIGSLAKLIKIAELAHADDKVMKVVIYGKTKKKYTLHPD